MYYRCGWCFQTVPYHRHSSVTPTGQPGAYNPGNHVDFKGAYPMQDYMIPCDVADLENVQAYLLYVKALLELVISDADSSSANTICKSASDSFDYISTALNGAHMLIDNILDYSTETINKAFKAHKVAKKGGKSNDEAEETNRA